MYHSPSNSTLLSWKRQILAGTASHATKVKLVKHVVNCILPPSQLMDAYLVARESVSHQEVPVDG